MVLCLGEPPGGFWDGGCCCFPHWRALRFQVTFPCNRHSTLAAQARERLHQLWHLTWLILAALLLPAFSVTFLPRVLRLWADIYYPQAHFYLALFPHIFVTFCDSSEGRNTPSRILLCTWPHRVVPCGWRMNLNYSYCSYNVIDLSIAPVSHEV